MGKHDRSDSSDEDRSHKKHKHPKDKDSKKHKKEKKEHKKEKHHHRPKDASFKEAEELKQAKRFLKERLATGGEPVGAAAAAAAAAEDAAGPPLVPLSSVAPITDDDYFARNAEFSSWLRDTQRTFFSDLTTEEARARFAGFVAVWNAGRLPPKFYTGAAAGAAQRTGFKWGFSGAGSGGAERTALGLAAAEEERAALQAAARQADRDAGRAITQRQRDQGQSYLDELMPKAGSAREAKGDARAARRADARDRDASPDVARVAGGGDVMGGDDSFQAARARESKRQEGRSRQQAVRREETVGRLAVAQAAEDAKLERFRALLASGPIQIAKRQ